ncbi:hypothetical protein POTTS_123 [Klebsiella phage vB_KpnM_Potts1]|uniref:Uncharacterized protein n=1 Tax=Klebsiella phage vB_KpnM_Potts1 TaxID=2591366 RepID=A0A5B9NNZ9_9CAUD|nr:hypothetical protein POTTS_123 [Klebsiella phage vB_KpnM_Potts1]
MMMHYGYALAYKDLPGFVLPYDTGGYCKVFNDEAAAEREFNGLKDYLNHRLSTRIKSVEHQTVPRRWWFPKVLIVTTHYSDDELKSLRQIINTLHVKKVRLA